MYCCTLWSTALGSVWRWESGCGNADVVVGVEEVDEDDHDDKGFGLMDK